MASAIGHSMAAIAAYKIAETYLVPSGKLPVSGKWAFILPAFLGILPDMDVFVRMVQSGFIHRGPTHSITLCIGYALLVSLLFIKRTDLRAFLYIFGVFSLCIVLHPFMDYIMGYGPKIALFWPFSDKGYISTFHLLPPTNAPRAPGDFLRILLRPKIWFGFVLEAIQFMPLILLCYVRPSYIKIVCVMISAGGFSLVYYIYN